MSDLAATGAGGEGGRAAGAGDTCESPPSFLRVGSLEVNRGDYCRQLVIGSAELAGARVWLCRGHTQALAAALAELGFVLELAGGRTFDELTERLPARVVAALERRKERLVKRGA